MAVEAVVMIVLHDDNRPADVQYVPDDTDKSRWSTTLTSSEESDLRSALVDVMWRIA